MGRTSISASSNSPIIASQVVANLTCKDTAHFCCSFLLQFVDMLYYHHLKNLMFTIHFYRPSAPHGRNPPLTNLLIKSGSPQPVLSIVVRQTVLPESIGIIWGYTVLFYTQNTYSYLFIWHASSSTSMTWQNIFVCQSLCQRLDVIERFEHINSNWVQIVLPYSDLPVFQSLFQPRLFLMSP